MYRPPLDCFLAWKYHLRAPFSLCYLFLRAAFPWQQLLFRHAMWNICGWMWRLSTSALVSEWPKTMAKSHSLLPLLCNSPWDVLLCSHPRTYSISSFAFKMHHTTVANTFTHDVRSNLFTIFLERRLKLDSLLFLSGWAGREDKLGFAIPLSATKKMRRDIFYFTNSVQVCTPDAAIHSPWALTPRGSTPARQSCCSPCRRWHPEDMVRVISLHTNIQGMRSLSWAVR